MEKPPIVVLVGTSGAGKTTFLEKLIAELKRSEIRIGTIKHDVHGFEMDQPGKDTWRHARAGADAVAISSPEKVAVIRKVPQELTLDQVAELLGDVDLILVEGYKSSRKPKIEIKRKAHSVELISSTQDLIALVSDGDWDLGVPVFDPEDAPGVAVFLINKFNL